jgi:hypothetical protein
MKVTIQSGDQSMPLGPVKCIGFTFGDGIRRTYQVGSYTQTPLSPGFKLEEYLLTPMSGEQEVVPNENALARLRRIRDLFSGGNNLQALVQLDDLIDDLH